MQKQIQKKVRKNWHKEINFSDEKKSKKKRVRTGQNKVKGSNGVKKWAINANFKNEIERMSVEKEVVRTFNKYIRLAGEL